MVPVSPAAVEAWLDRAQHESVQEIIVEVCEGQDRAVDVLIQTVNCGTPKDLSLWGRTANASALLHGQITRNLHRCSDDDDDTWWCRRASNCSGGAIGRPVALEQCEWLHWHVTPVAD